MAAKVHKSLRLDSDLVDRVTALKFESEPLSNAMCRVMAVGCDTLEGVRRNDTVNYERIRTEHAQGHDEATQKLIALLEKDIERLTAEHENDLKRLEEKDAVIAKALQNAHELADQAQIIAGIAHDPKQLTTADDDGEMVDVDPLPKRITFREWWTKYRKGL